MNDNIDQILRISRGIAYFAVIVGLPIVAFKALPLLERTVIVLENLDKKADRTFEAVAPLGRETIDKGIDTIKEVDAEGVGRDLTDAIRRKLKFRADK